MKFGIWKLEIRNWLFIILFLSIPFFIPSFISAQSSNPIESTSTAVIATPSGNNNSPQPSAWQRFWGWFLGIFIKDYDIPTDTSSQQKNFTDYGHVGDPKNENINSTENRSTSSNQQFYFKGQYIKDVIDGVMFDKTIARICDQKIVSLTNTCGSDFKISCLARYFVEDKQSFLYSDQNGTKIDLSLDLIQSIKDKSSNCIILPQPQFAEYQNIYLNFFRVPPEYEDATKNENASRVIRTPIPNSVQSPIPNNPAEIGQDIKDQQKQLNQNFIPEGSNWNGLSSLRPDNWDEDSFEANWDVGSGLNNGVSSGTCNALKSHCEGMSIYGALGLSQSGKSYQEILKFYYGNISLKTLNTSNLNITVNVSNGDDCSKYQPLNLETYLSGLGEMPNYWGSPSKGGYETMKALVVAARTFAYMYTENLTKPICTTSNCQVFRCNLIKTMPYLDQAIKETSGQIIVDYDNQTPFITLYARSFCGPSKTVVYPNHTNPSVNGYEYELKARNGEQPFCINN